MPSLDLSRYPLIVGPRNGCLHLSAACRTKSKWCIPHLGPCGKAEAIPASGFSRVSVMTFSLFSPHAVFAIPQAVLRFSCLAFLLLLSLGESDAQGVAVP